MSWHVWVDTAVLGTMLVLTVVDVVRNRRESRRQHAEWMAALKDKHERQMTEPTAEQVEAERERAHALLEALCFPCISVERPGMRHDEDCGMVSTALARVRIEAHSDHEDDLREALDNIERMKVRNIELIADIERRETERATWVKERVDIGIKYDLYRANHEAGPGCAKAHAAGRDDAEALVRRRAEESEGETCVALCEAADAIRALRGCT